VNQKHSNTIFVVGSFRSGTSLLYSLLNQHPDVALMYECNVWDFPGLFSSLRFRRNWLERQEFHNQALSRHRLIFGGRLRGLENVRTPEELYLSFSKGKGALFQGEKSPVYCPRLLRLAQRYPGCSFILLWRDPVEIYRSVIRAGSKNRYFRRSNWLNWLIYCHEQMIQQAAGLSRAGIRVHHVTYNRLVDRTREVCENLCRYLGIEFDPAMLDLTRADFSAIDQAPQHDHLRRGIIERQHFSEEVVPAPVIKKLHRFRSRWDRLKNGWPGIENNAPVGTEPGRLELLYHKLVGSAIYLSRNLKRVLFEFLPLPWLRTYRLTKNWFLGRHATGPVRKPSLAEELSSHWVTILASAMLLAVVAVVDFVSSPQIIFGPFYLIPCAALTLVVGRRWGTLAAASCALILTWERTLDEHAPLEIGLLLWNTAMRFVFFQVIVVLLDRIRVEMNSPVNSTGNDPS
jgi:hypothetical protein